MTKLTFALSTAVLLAACGGGDVGDVQCNVAGACTVNVTVAAGAVQTGPITINNNGTSAPAPSASAPAPSASAPAPSASAPAPSATGPLPLALEATPFATTYVKTPLTMDVGTFSWKTQDRAYMLRIGDAGGIMYVILFFSPLDQNGNATTWSVAESVDDSLDLHFPAVTAFKPYIETYVLPKLNQYLAATPSATSGTLTVGPVTSRVAPADWTAIDKLSAFLASNLVWDFSGSTPQIKFR